MTGKAPGHLFPLRFDTGVYGWTAEHGKQIRVKTDFLLQEVAVLQETKEAIAQTPNEAEQTLTSIARDNSVDCLLTGHEKYWALRFLGALPWRPKDAPYFDRYKTLSDVTDCARFSERLRPITVSNNRTGGTIFMEKKDGFEMPRLECYIAPIVGLREGSRSPISADEIAAKVDEWRRDRTLLRRLFQFRELLTPTTVAKNNEPRIWETWTDGDIATVFVLQMILDKDEDQDKQFSRLVGKYLRAWERVIRTSGINGLVNTEARSGDNVLMMTHPKKDSPFWLGFRDTLWKRVRQAESTGNPVYDPYHRESTEVSSSNRIEESELFRPFFWGKRSLECCRPGAPGETLIHEEAVVDFSLMLVRLRLVELRRRVNASESLWSRVSREDSRLFNLSNPPVHWKFGEWVKLLPPCLSNRFIRLAEEFAKHGKLGEGSNQQWALERTLEMAAQLYRANGWPVTELLDVHPFDRLDRIRRVATVNAETKVETLSCQFFFSRNECPLKRDQSGETLSGCVFKCKKTKEVGDIEDLAAQLASCSPFPVAGTNNWNPWIAASIARVTSSSGASADASLVRQNADVRMEVLS